MSNKGRGQRAETALRAILQERGYLVIRSAASKVYDLVCVDEGGFVFFLEVKSVKSHCYRVSRTAMTKEQHAQMQRDSERYGYDNIGFVYAVRFPDGEYRFYSPEFEIMPQHGGISLDYAFPLRITPNNPPIVPHEAMSYAEIANKQFAERQREYCDPWGNEQSLASPIRADDWGNEHPLPDGGRDAQC